MEYIYFILGNVVFLYSIFILLLVYGFYNVPEITYQTTKPQNNFTIVVVFKNSEEFLERLVASLAFIEYPLNKFEVIFVNNHSQDGSKDLLKTLLRFTKLNSKIIDLGAEEKGKRAALTKAVSQSSFNWILTTVPNGEVSSMWLKTFDQKIQEEPNLKLITGPVSLILKDDGFLSTLQSYDFTALIGATVGGFGIERPFLSNFANMALNREEFLKLGGYQEDENSRGGELYLLDLFRKEDPNSIAFLKSKGAIVNTIGAIGFNTFFLQRIKWLSKTVSYKSTLLKLTSLFIGMSNFFVVLTVILFLATLKMKLLFFLVFKFIVEYWLLRVSNNMLNKPIRLATFPYSSIVFPFYITYIGLHSIYLKKIKDRDFKSIFQN